MIFTQGEQFSVAKMVRVTDKFGMNRRIQNRVEGFAGYVRSVL
jgi:hypothetical protein